MPRREVPRFLREPLVAFLLLGAALFLLPAAALRGRGGESRRVVITASEVASLEEAFRRTWLREPTSAEIEALVAKTADEEILAREAMAMGLDRDDAVVRRRLRQKLESTVEAAARLARPTQADLEAFLRAHPDRYATDARLTFRQVFFSPERRGARAASDAAATLEGLRAGRAGDPASLGDATLLPAELRDMTLREIEGTFGSELAGQIAKAPVAEWSGPVRSGYGLHLLFVEAKSPGRPAALSEVREAVVRDWETARTKASIETYYAALAKKYAVVVEPRSGPERAASTPESP